MIRPTLLALALGLLAGARGSAGPPPGPPLRGDFLHQLTRALARHGRAHQVPESSLDWLGERAGRSCIQIQEALWAVDEELERLARGRNPKASTWLPEGTLVIAAEQGDPRIRRLLGRGEAPAAAGAAAEAARDPEASYWLGLRYLGPDEQDLTRARGLLEDAAARGYRGAAEKLEWLDGTRKAPRVIELASRPSSARIRAGGAGCQVRVRLSRAAGGWQVETSLEEFSPAAPAGQLLAHRVREVPSRRILPVLRKLTRALARPRQGRDPDRVLRLSLAGRGVPLVRDLSPPDAAGCGADAELARALGGLAAPELVTCEGEGCLPCRCTDPSSW